MECAHLSEDSGAGQRRTPGVTLLDRPGPGIAQGADTIEDRLVGAMVDTIGDEVAEAFELEACFRRDVRE